MAGPSRHLSKSEWQIMVALWDHGRATAVDLQAGLQATQPWAYSTVKTMLDRLVEKGYVAARRVGNVYEYTPRVPRRTAVGRMLDDVRDRLFAGSVAPFVQYCIDQKRLTAEDAKTLREMLDRYEAAGGE
jgi:BlaI family transcriptional regulator, penicillinase repressor